MSFSYQMNLPLWCIPFCVLLTTLRFEPMGSLSLSSRKYARYVTFRDVGPYAHLTSVRNSCIQNALFIGIFATAFLLSTTLPNVILMGTVNGKISCIT